MFGLFLHMGGTNVLPLSFVDNCAEAIVLGGLKPGVDGEVFNVVDDDPLTSRQFLRAYRSVAGSSLIGAGALSLCQGALCPLGDVFAMVERAVATRI